MKSHSDLAHQSFVRELVNDVDQVLHSSHRHAWVYGLDSEGHVVAVSTNLREGRGFLLFCGKSMPNPVVCQALHDRLRACFTEAGWSWPGNRCEVRVFTNAPVYHPRMDLAVAMSVARATGMVDPAHLEQKVFVGRLTKNGWVEVQVSDLGDATRNIGRGRKGFFDVIAPKEGERFVDIGNAFAVPHSTEEPLVLG